MNAKLSEMHAAMGMAVLPHVEAIMEARRTVTGWYDAKLQGPRTIRPAIPDGTRYNYAYYPIILPDQDAVMAVMARLGRSGIHPRRYFFPSLDTLPYVSSPPCPISRSMCSRVLCLPLHPELDREDVERIAALVNETGN
jgi:dTDP-4-amino-4,6-dideoxygalactose transaminase